MHFVFKNYYWPWDIQKARDHCPFIPSSDPKEELTSENTGLPYYATTLLYSWLFSQENGKQDRNLYTKAHSKVIPRRETMLRSRVRDEMRWMGEWNAVIWLCTVVHTFSSSTREAEAETGASLWVWDQSRTSSRTASATGRNPASKIKTKRTTTIKKKKQIKQTTTKTQGILFYF